jgi:hypothetical protein
MNTIERVHTSFTDYLGTNQAKGGTKSYTRYKGGHKATNGPYVSGYWYLLIELPIKLSNISTPKQSDNLFPVDGEVRKKIQKYLHATAESFTPPSKTIQKGEISGYGGVKKYVILNQSITPTFSVSFFELSGMPIQKIFKIWSNMINSQYGFTQSQIYKGKLFAFLCKPTWTPDDYISDPNNQGVQVPTSYNISPADVEEMFYFEGVFPESDGNDVLSTNISQNSIATYNIQFSFDSYYFGMEHEDILADGLTKLKDVTGGASLLKLEDVIP